VLADIFLALVGNTSEDTTGELSLRAPATQAEPFMRGQTDSFTASGGHIAALRTLHVWRSAGPSDWCPEWISVLPLGAARTLYFRFGSWLRNGGKLTACAAVLLVLVKPSAPLCKQ
jgi:PLAT/LH2 domain